MTVTTSLYAQIFYGRTDVIFANSTVRQGLVMTLTTLRASRLPAAALYVSFHTLCANPVTTYVAQCCEINFRRLSARLDRVEGQEHPLQPSTTVPAGTSTSCSRTRRQCDCNFMTSWGLAPMLAVQNYQQYIIVCPMLRMEKYKFICVCVSVCLSVCPSHFLSTRLQVRSQQIFYS